VAQGEAPRIPQDESQASYEKPAEDPLVRIDWREPAQAVYNVIRGCDPSPGAWTRLGGNKVRLTDARLKGGEAAPPGVIAAISEEGLLVGGNGGSILARKLSGETGAAVAAQEFAAAQGLQPGMRFLNAKKPA